jgi:hypothetical protein
MLYFISKKIKEGKEQHYGKETAIGRKNQEK